MNKKGQVAMAFFMTYGWAILVVLVAIGALAYFGVLAPKVGSPDNVTTTEGGEEIALANTLKIFSCSDELLIADEEISNRLFDEIRYDFNFTDEDRYAFLAYPWRCDSGCYALTLTGWTIPHEECIQISGTLDVGLLKKYARNKFEDKNRLR